MPPLPLPLAAAARCGRPALLLTPTRHVSSRSSSRSNRSSLVVAAEKKEYYDYKDMPPLPLVPIARIHIPQINYTVVDQSCEATRTASLAIFYDIFQDDQYAARLSRKSALTALCMYDKEDVEEAQKAPGDFPNIDLLYKVYNEGLDYAFVVEEVGGGGSRP